MEIRTKDNTPEQAEKVEVHQDQQYILNYIDSGHMIWYWYFHFHNPLGLVLDTLDSGIDLGSDILDDRIDLDLGSDRILDHHTALALDPGTDSDSDLDNHLDLNFDTNLDLDLHAPHLLPNYHAYPHVPQTSSLYLSYIYP
jgi:hypothetical protein